MPKTPCCSTRSKLVVFGEFFLIFFLFSVHLLALRRVFYGMSSYIVNDSCRPNPPPIIGPLRYTTFMVVGWAVVQSLKYFCLFNLSN